MWAGCVVGILSAGAGVVVGAGGSVTQMRASGPRSRKKQRLCEARSDVAVHFCRTLLCLQH